MATGGENNGVCDWNTRRETIGPPEPQSTLIGDKAGAAFIVVNEVSFLRAGHKMGDDKNNVTRY